MRFIIRHSPDSIIDDWEKQHAVFSLSPDEYMAALEETLNLNLVLALKVSRFSEQREQIAQIHSLEDLKNSGVYMLASDLLPTNPNELKTIEHAFIAGTSGSTAERKFIPYDARALTHAALGYAPFVAGPILELHKQGITEPRMLALTASESYITYYLIPSLCTQLGIEVVQVPLSLVNKNDEALKELITLINNEEIHMIGTVAPMLFSLVERIRQFEGGDEALLSLGRDLRYIISGGTEVYEGMVRNLQGILGENLRVSNLLASTEGAIIAGNDGFGRVEVMTANPYYAVIGIIPQSELDKEEENPNYTPKMTLLHEAAPETIGELVITVPLTFPWVKLRTGDYIKIIESEAEDNLPAFIFYTRGSSILDIGGAKIYPREISDVMKNLGVTDFIAQGIKNYVFDAASGDLEQLTREEASQFNKMKERAGRFDVLVVMYEGEARPNEIYNALMEAGGELSFILNNNMARLEVHQVPSNYLMMQRGQMMQKRNAIGPIKHGVIKIPNPGSIYYPRDALR